MSMTTAHSRITRRWALGMLLLCVCSLQCQRQSVGERKQIPSSASDARPLVHFVDVTESAGLSRFLQENGHREKPYIVESIGGGVAFLDYDNDGDLDIYLTNGCHWRASRPAVSRATRSTEITAQGCSPR